MLTANISQSEQLAQSEASHKEGMAHLRSEMEASASTAVAQKVAQLLTSHAEEMDELRAELESTSSAEMQRLQFTAEEQRLAEMKQIKN